MIRTIIVLCISALYVQSVPRHQYTANFDIDVEEKGTKFQQTVQTDIDNNVIYYYTPSHNDVLEMYKIQDFTQHVEVFCFPLKSECYMSKLNRTLYLDASGLTSSLAQGYGVNKNKFNDKDKELSVQKNKWYKTGNKFDIRFFMSKPVLDFVKEFNFPIYEIASIPDNAEFLDGDDKNSVEPNQRPKRQTDVPAFTVNCNGGLPPLRKYGYTTHKSCDYLTFCKARTCRSTHVEDAIFYACMCCPEHHRTSECAFCSKMDGAP